MDLDKMRLYIRPEFLDQVASVTLYNQPVEFACGNDGHLAWLDLLHLGIAQQPYGTMMNLKVSLHPFVWACCLGVVLACFCLCTCLCKGGACFDNHAVCPTLLLCRAHVPADHHEAHSAIDAIPVRAQRTGHRGVRGELHAARGTAATDAGRAEQRMPFGLRQRDQGGSVASAGPS